MVTDHSQHTQMTAEVKLRKASVDDLTRVNSNGVRVWIDGKDLWALGVNDDLQYYRMNIKHPEIPKMVKALLPAGRVLVVDVEGVENQWLNQKSNQ